MKSNLVRFFLAFVLAVAAAVLNAVWLYQKTPALERYAVFKTDITKGTVIDPSEHVDVINIPVLEKKMPEVFLPYKNRYSLSGWVAIRDFQEGEMVQHADIKPVDSLPEYEVLGPFRLISVGSRFSRDIMEENDDMYSDENQNAVTIAVKRQFNEATRRLLQIIEARKENNDAGSLRIIAVTTFLQPEDSKSPTGQKAPLVSKRPTEKMKDTVDISQKLGPDEIALFVPLPDVPAISQVLLAEENPQIGFVVPAEIVRSDLMQKEHPKTSSQ